MDELMGPASEASPGGPEPACLEGGSDHVRHSGCRGCRDQNQALASVLTMSDALSRRGPDGQGLHRWPTAVLGHRRLAIFDLSSAGNQPMLSADGSTGVVFNGAIYNFPGLRSELVGLGHEFRSRTDTEVLVNGYREWGLDRLVAKLVGMFAFALWDDRVGKLWLVRDRLGVEPLMFAERDGAIAFASTVRALRLAGYGSDLDTRAVIDYLRFGFVPEEVSIYRGIVKSRRRRSWSGPEDVGNREPTGGRRSRVPGSVSFDEAVTETERLLLDAVRARLQADVPVCALLSGGIDSSLVCWAVSRVGGDVTAFTIGTAGDPGTSLLPLAKQPSGSGSGTKS